MTVHLKPEQANEIERRVTAGESRAAVGADFGLLDREVLVVVNKVRTARAARTGDTPQPAPAAVAPVPGRGRPSVSAGEPAPGRPETTGRARSGDGRNSGEDSPSSPAGSSAPSSPVASRVGRLLTTGSPVGGPTTAAATAGPLDPRDYVEHSDKRISKAAAAAVKALEALGGLVFAWQTAETARQEQEKARAEAEAAVEKAERELAEAREKLRAATGKKAPKRVTYASGTGPTAAEIRRWAAENGVECPSRGQIPARVREAFEAAMSPDGGPAVEVSGETTQEAS
jgi:hypothetical protein